MDVLKWAALVFAAGFVGYFGKYLGKLVIKRLHKPKAEGAAMLQPAGNMKSRYDYKLEKKRVKVEKKRLKETKNS